MKSLENMLGQLLDVPICGVENFLGDMFGQINNILDTSLGSIFDQLNSILVWHFIYSSGKTACMVAFQLIIYFGYCP